MASIAAGAATAALVRGARPAGVSPPPARLPRRGAGGGGARCSRPATGGSRAAAAAPGGMGASSVLAAVSVMSLSNPALALVDERMSTEGMGLSLGLSNNVLGWILLGVFGVVWSLYFVYTSTLEEDEDSGLSL